MGALGPGPLSLLLPCLPQSEKASSEEAGGGEYVNLYSSGQTREELVPSRGVSNLSGWPCTWATHCPPRGRFPCSYFYWLSPIGLLEANPSYGRGHGFQVEVCPAFASASLAFFRTWLNERPRNYWILSQPQLLPGISSPSSLNADPFFQEMLLLLPFSSSQHALLPSATPKEAGQVIGALLDMHTCPS